VCSRANYFALIQNDNQIAIDNRRESVSDNNHGSTLGNSINGFPHVLLV
jgi:hypothetical protein